MAIAFYDILSLTLAKFVIELWLYALYISRIRDVHREGIKTTFMTNILVIANKKMRVVCVLDLTFVWTMCLTLKMEAV